MERKYIKPRTKAVKMIEEGEMLAGSVTFDKNGDITNGSQIGAKETIDGNLPESKSVWDD